MARRALNIRRGSLLSLNTLYVRTYLYITGVNHIREFPGNLASINNREQRNRFCLCQGPEIGGRRKMFIRLAWPAPLALLLTELLRQKLELIFFLFSSSVTIM